MSRKFYRMCILYEKDTFVNYLSNGTLGTTVAVLEAELQQFPYSVVFADFFVHTSTWELMNRRMLLNPPKIALLGNCRSLASIRVTNIER